MNFDWGSFLGGVAGALGAFLSAAYLFRVQKRANQPKMDRARHNLYTAMKNNLQSISWTMVLFLGSRKEAQEFSIKKLLELEKLIPDALETDRNALVMIRRVRSKFEAFHEKDWANNTIEGRGKTLNYVDSLVGIVRPEIEECERILAELENN